MWESQKTSLKLGRFMDSYLNWRGNVLILFLAAEGNRCCFSEQRGLVRDASRQRDRYIVRGNQGRNSKPSNNFLVPTYLGEDKNPMALFSVILPSKIATLQNETIIPKDAGLCHPSFCSHLNFFPPHQQPISVQALTNSGLPLLVTSPVF